MTFRIQEQMTSPLAYLLCGVVASVCQFGSSSFPKELDPAAWGGDHVGRPVPEYVTGDECLFCHRSDIGPAWSKNRHQLTIHELEPNSTALVALKKLPDLAAFADEAKLALGGQQSSRFLKRSAHYGKLDLLSIAWDKSGKVRILEKGHWDPAKFAKACAGCHTTGVDPKTGAFSAVALDCYTCHGEVTLNHSKDTQLIYLSKNRHDPARVVTSICAQCHVRTGKSRSSGLPYANNFVAGDNLFRDFQVEFSPEALKSLNPADRHVLQNVRDVAVLGKEDVTCLSCHDVHKQSTGKHRRLTEDQSCLICHNATGSKKVRRAYEVHSQACEY
jgi:hypothetical protein